MPSILKLYTFVFKYNSPETEGRIWAKRLALRFIVPVSYVGNNKSSPDRTISWLNPFALRMAKTP